MLSKAKEVKLANRFVGHVPKAFCVETQQEVFRLFAPMRRSYFVAR
jgi:hypothetical protein